MNLNIPKPNPQEALDYFQKKIDCSTGPIEVNHWIDEDANIHIVDVRRPEDYEKGHVPGAVNIPKEKWQSTDDLSMDSTNVVYCYSQTCHLAASAAVMFAKKGYSVIEMDGGWKTWQENYLPIEKGATVKR